MLKNEHEAVPLPGLFVVHGRNNKMREYVVEVLGEFRLQCVFMRNNSDQEQKSLAQKLTEHKEVAAAVVILSGDDFVYSRDRKPRDAVLCSSQRTVFELGFLVGRLGRERVFVIYYDQKSFRIPGEYFNAIYIPLDKKGLWRRELAERLVRTKLFYKTGDIQFIA